MATKQRGHGEGSITQRNDGRWMARVSLPDGSRKSFYGATRREAQQKLTAALRNLEQGRPIAPERQTVGDFLTKWLASAKPNLRPSTYQRYEEVLRLHILPTLGKHRLARLMPPQLQALYAAKLAEGQAPRSVRKIHALLHRALGQARRWRLIPANPCDDVEQPRPADQAIQPLSPEQARALLAAATDDPLEALYVLALTTGMRQGELLALRWGDVDLERRRLAVTRTVRRISGQGWHVGPPKSKSGLRRIELTDLAVAALRRHRERQRFQRLAAGEAWQEQDLVFTNEVGGFIEATNLVQRSFRPLLERATLPRIRFHDLRHSTASLLLVEGKLTKVVQELLGHSSIQITDDTYRHVAPVLHRDAVDALERLLRPTAGPTPSLERAGDDPEQTGVKTGVKSPSSGAEAG